MNEQLDKFRGSLLGLAVGDAVGTTAEFKPRGSFKPLTDMVGGGPFNLQAGQWTDDTSMALCLATSLVECGRFDAYDQMERYCRWADEGYLSSTGTCFDIGGTVAAALNRFQQTGEPFAGSIDPKSAGNGSIMRLAPIPMFYYPDILTAQQFAVISSRTTHGAEECLDACRLLAGMIVRALAGKSRDEVVLAEAESFAGSPKIVSLAKGSYLRKSEGEIRGSGYVVESLEAALWCFMNTSSYMDAVLTAANLGEDADTTAAVCGQLSGAYYGETGIPPSWLEKLAMGEEITDLAEKLVYKLTNSKWSVQCDS
jgi:ADP-ribosyl-[dinitrogen reductase] hydrolase